MGQPGGVGPAGNGLVAYSSEGEIFIGDPVTGASTAITSGPEPDINPKFSPDGTRIAFVRGTPIRGPASLVVVQADGSAPRIVVPADVTRSAGGNIGPFAWTPDGHGIVVEVDFGPSTFPSGDGELGLFDASGVREPRLLVPPLPARVGAIYFNPSAQVAPMFRPPDGDLIVSSGTLQVFDADLAPVRPLGIESPSTAGAFDPTWSPDGASLVVSRGSDWGVSIVDAESGELHALGPGWWPMWSPDSSSIAYEDVGHDWGDGPTVAEVRLAVYHRPSGTTRVLESSVSPVKTGATVLTITSNPDHTWYYEGWSWSPDGRSILLLKDHRTRPIVVDVETDTATELPWETDSFPSWQRLGGPLSP